MNDLLKFIFLGISSIYKGFAFSLVWKWFAVPLGFIEIGIPWAVGLICLLSIARGPSTAVEPQEKDIKEIFVNELIVTSIFFAIAFIATFFI